MDFYKKVSRWVQKIEKDLKKLREKHADGVVIKEFGDDDDSELIDDHAWIQDEDSQEVRQRMFPQYDPQIDEETYEDDDEDIKKSFEDDGQYIDEDDLLDVDMPQNQEDPMDPLDPDYDGFETVDSSFKKSLKRLADNEPRLKRDIKTIIKEIS